MSKSFAEQMAEARAKKAADFQAQQTTNTSNPNNIVIPQTPATVIAPNTASNQGQLNLNQLLGTVLNFLQPLQAPGAVQNFVEQNGGAANIANTINQSSIREVMTRDLLPNEIEIGLLMLAKGDYMIEPGIKISGLRSGSDSKKTLAQEAYIREKLAEKIKAEGFTDNSKKLLADLSPLAQQKFIDYHLSKYDGNNLELKNEITNFIKNGCIVLDQSQGNVLGHAVVSEENAETELTFEALKKEFESTSNINKFIPQILNLNEVEQAVFTSQVIDGTADVPVLADLVNLYLDTITQ